MEFILLRKRPAKPPLLGTQSGNICLHDHADPRRTRYRLTVAEDLNFWTQGCTWVTMVSNGVQIDSEVDPSSTSTARIPVEWTVEQLHELISQWLQTVKEFASPERGEHALDVRFNDIGVPTAMVFDLANGADEESSMRVTFTPTA